MLQVDHVYEFFYQTLFKKFSIHSLRNGVFTNTKINWSDQCIFNWDYTDSKIFFVDQEPILRKFLESHLEYFTFPNPKSFHNSAELFIKLNNTNRIDLTIGYPLSEDKISQIQKNNQILFKTPVALIVSEYSNLVNDIGKEYNLNILYYFFHGFAALDWYRGFYALNYNKSVVREYQYDFISFNRLVTTDRSYRCYFVSKLIEKKLINHGQISFGLDTNDNNWQTEINSQETKLSNNAISHIKTYLPLINTPLVVDFNSIPGYASADIPRQVTNSFWHIVTETVFYYNKLHLTEKIFKPIVMKQPFMLLAGPGNLEYLQSYGFKTFNGIIDESYDKKVNPDDRIESVVDQLNWYCNLTSLEKLDIMKRVEPIVEYNFHHFYGEFKHIIATELLDNSKELFKKIGYDDSTIAYSDIYKTLVN